MASNCCPRYKRTNLRYTQLQPWIEPIYSLSSLNMQVDLGWEPSHPTHGVGLSRRVLSDSKSCASESLNHLQPSTCSFQKISGFPLFSSFLESNPMHPGHLPLSGFSNLHTLPTKKNGSPTPGRSSRELSWVSSYFPTCRQKMPFPELGAFSSTEYVHVMACHGNMFLHEKGDLQTARERN